MTENKKARSLDKLINKCDLCKGQKVIGWEHLKLFNDKTKNEYKQCFRCKGLGYIIKKEGR